MENQEKPNELTPFQPQGKPQYFNVNTWKAMQLMAQTFIKSGALPSHIKNAEQLMVIMQAGKEMGLYPMEAITNLYMINGKVATQGVLMIKKIRQAGVDLEFTEETDTKCTVIFSGLGRKPYTATFTIEDAKKAGLTNKVGPWTQYPKIMLRWRAISIGARVFCPDITQGIYLIEELKGVVEDKQAVGTVQPNPNDLPKPPEPAPEPKPEPKPEPEKAPAMQVENDPDKLVEKAKEVLHGEVVSGQQKIEITREDLPP